MISAIITYLIIVLQYRNSLLDAKDTKIENYITKIKTENSTEVNNNPGQSGDNFLNNRRLAPKCT